MISATITDRSGRTLSGQTLDAFYVSIRHARPFSVGLNCALGARADAAVPRRARRALPTSYVTCYPNAGLPNAFGEYDELPAETARLLRDFADSGFVEHPRRLLRHDARSHPRDRRGGRWTAAAARASGSEPGRTSVESEARVRTRFTQFAGLETLTIRPDTQLHHDRRADQRHRLEALRAHDREPAVPRRRGDRPRAGARRREHPRRQHGRRDARLGSGDDDVPERHRDRAGDRAPADHDRQLEVVGARSRASSASRARPSSTRSA